MESFHQHRKWKYIIVHKNQENEYQKFELDDSQRLVHKFKRQKKRSIKLATIGFYENNKMQNFINEIVEESQKKTNKSKNINISFINQSNSIDVHSNKENMLLDENELDLFSLFDFGKQINESQNLNSEEFVHEFNEQTVEQFDLDINSF